MGKHPSRKRLTILGGDSNPTFSGGEEATEQDFSATRRNSIRASLSSPSSSSSIGDVSALRSQKAPPRLNSLSSCIAGGGISEASTASQSTFQSDSSPSTKNGSSPPSSSPAARRLSPPNHLWAQNTSASSPLSSLPSDRFAISSFLSPTLTPPASSPSSHLLSAHPARSLFPISSWSRENPPHHRKNQSPHSSPSTTFLIPQFSTAMKCFVFFILGIFIAQPSQNIFSYASSAVRGVTPEGVVKRLLQSASLQHQQSVTSLSSSSSSSLPMVMALPSSFNASAPASAYPTPRDALRAHTNHFKRQLIRVKDNILVAVGYGLANSVWIRGKDGITVVDVLESGEAMSELLKDISKESSFFFPDKEREKQFGPPLQSEEQQEGSLSGEELRSYNSSSSTSSSIQLPLPLKAIIYTHAHQDHIFGGSALVRAFPQSDSVQVWSHPAVLDEIDRTLSVTGSVVYRRAMRQFGVFVPRADFENAGIGPELHYDAHAAIDLVRPDHLMQGPIESIVIDGLSMSLISAPGETKEQVVVYLPDSQTLIGADNFYWTFPNLYAIRGTPSRDLQAWVDSIDIMRKVKCSHLIPLHTQPLKGRKEIDTILRNYRDAIQYLHDQTIRWMNKGRALDDVVASIKLPPQLKDLPYLQEFYGTVEWGVRAVFTHYLGWFSGDPKDLTPLAPLKRAEMLQRLAGGKNELVKAAKAAIQNAEPQWALELTSAGTRLHPTDGELKDLHVAALTAMADTQTSAPGRNYFITCALEARGDIRLDVVPAQKKQAIDRVEDVRKILSLLRFRFMSEKANTTEAMIEWKFSDVDDPSKGVACFSIRNGIVDATAKACSSDTAIDDGHDIVDDATIDSTEDGGGGLVTGVQISTVPPPTQKDFVQVVMTSETFRQIASQTISAVSAVAARTLIVEKGGLLTFARLMRLFDNQENE